MEFLSSIWNWLDEEFRAVLALSASIFTIYFAYMKFGNKVGVSYSITTEKSSHSRINNLIFRNMRDKPVTIYKVVAIFDKTYYFEIIKCSPPLILKPYETIALDTEQFSHLNVNNDRYFPDFEKPEIYIETGSKVVKCKTKFHKTQVFDYMQVSKITNKFNGIVYDENVSFALVYRVNGENKTAFIFDSGFIGCEWDFHINAIWKSNENIKAIEICDFLNNILSEEIEFYALYKLNKDSLKFEQINFYKNKGS